MFPFRKILFPVDYSEPSMLVAPYVQDMAKRFDAEVTLLHAYTANVLIPGEDAGDDAAWLERMHKRQERRLHNFASEMFAELPVRTVVENNEAAAAIHAHAIHQGTDLAMLPTEGRGPVRRFLLGSVTAKVLHDTDVAVWTASRAAMTDQPMRVPYRSIVCALDESDEAEAVLRAAHGLATRYGASLSLLHAVPVPALGWDIDFAVYQKELMDAADLRVRELKSTLNIDAPHLIAHEPLVEVMRDEVGRRKADLIVAGRGHAQGMLGGVWSRLYALVREAPCPVMSV